MVETSFGVANLREVFQRGWQDVAHHASQDVNVDLFSLHNICVLEASFRNFGYGVGKDGAVASCNDWFCD